MSNRTMVPGFAYTGQGRERFRDVDNALVATLNDITESRNEVLDFTNNLEAGETISSVAYEDRGATSSGKSNTAITASFTLTGIGDCKVTVTMSTGRKYVQLYRNELAASRGAWSDYGNR